MKIFVACSMNGDIDDKFIYSSKLLLEEILKENDLVFGACNQGIMGVAYNIAMQNGREIIGVCPEVYKDDFKSLNCTTEITTINMPERMTKFIDNSDMQIYLTGGYGTLFEFFSAIERKRGKEFEAPIILYNDENLGYYDELISFLQSMRNNNFSKEKEEDTYYIARTPQEVIDIVNKYSKKHWEKTKK